MEKISIGLRQSFRYVGTYAHLDAWQDVGTAVLTPSKMVREAESFDEGGTYIRWATLPRGQDIEASISALEDTLTRHGCAHEWDCCGCASYGTMVIHRHGRRLVLKTTVSFNY
jgi:hypothetical protein